jgi:hypothetical protein
VADQLSLPTPTPSAAPSPTWGQVVATPLLTERSLGAYEGRRSEHVLDEFGRLRWDHLPEPRMMGLWDIIAEESSCTLLLSCTRSDRPGTLTCFTRVHNAANQMGVESKFEFLSRAQRAIQFMIAHIVSYLTHFVSRNAVPEIRVLCVSHGTRFSPRSLFVFLSMRLSVSAACVGVAGWSLAGPCRWWPRILSSRR